MALYSKYLQMIPKASFTAIYLSNQIYGEVDPSFVKEYGPMLVETWKVIDYKDTLHTVTFNMSFLRPLLTTGWREMKEVFGFDTNQEVEFLYYGNSVFGLMCSKTLECCCQIPMYHSRFVRFGCTIEFYIDVTSDNITKPFLSVFSSFEEYLRATNLKYFIACLDNGIIDTFDIALTDKPFKTTSIGIGWDSFCVMGEFVVGDLLCFKFTLLDRTDVACVYKLNE